MSPMNSSNHSQQRTAGKLASGNVVVALVQMSGHTAKDRNVAKAVERIGQAAAAGANIVCLQ
jgi:hypothetical protein